MHPIASALVFLRHASVLISTLFLIFIWCTFFVVAQAVPMASVEPEFGSPGISLNPQNLSFNMDSPYHEWERIDICVYNPTHYHISRATIILVIPETLEFKINTDTNSIFHYNPTTTTFTIENFGEYNRSTECDWFEIRPRVDTTSKKDVISLYYEIEYWHRVFNYYSNSSLKNIESTNISYNSTNVASNFTQYGMATINQNDSVSVVIKNPERSIFSTIQENLWIIAVGSFISSVLLLIVECHN